MSPLKPHIRRPHGPTPHAFAVFTNTAPSGSQTNVVEVAALALSFV